MTEMVLGIGPKLQSPRIFNPEFTHPSVPDTRQAGNTLVLGSSGSCQDVSRELAQQ